MVGNAEDKKKRKAKCFFWSGSQQGNPLCCQAKWLTEWDGVVGCGGCSGWLDLLRHAGAALEEKGADCLWDGC